MKRLIAFLTSGVLMLTVIFAPLCVHAEATQAPPPTVIEITATRIDLEEHEGYEYSLGGSFWSPYARYRELTPNREYTVYQRVKDQPETQSEPLKVKTPEKLPHPGPAPVPEVMLCDSNKIDLVMHYGCEFRINGGSWQSTASFNNLQPDTEYTFEARWKETEDYQASQISQPLVARTHKIGPSSILNHEQLVEYVEANGTENEAQDKFLAYVMQDELGAEYYFVLTKEASYYFTAELIYDGVEETGLAFDLKFDLYKNSDDILMECETILVAEDTIVDQVDFNQRIYKTEIDEDYTFTTGQSGDYLTSDDLSLLTDQSLKLLLTFWDEMLYSKLGFGLKGLGFTSMPGYGETSCNPASGYHVGELETLYQREPSCAIYGSRGYQYCTTCHQRVSGLGGIEYTESHTYDNGCDPVCNTCGSQREVRHTFGYGCEEICDKCGTKREVTYASHTPDKTGLCSVCGEQCRIPGDITGEGLVNMVDVTKLYAHVRRTNVITDPATLAVLDITGEGLVNMADVSALYARVRGKK